MIYSTSKMITNSTWKFGAALGSAVQRSVAPCRAMLPRGVQRCVAPRRAATRCAVRRRAALCGDAPRRAVWRCTTPCCVVPRRAVSRRVMQRCAAPCRFFPTDCFWHYYLYEQMLSGVMKKINGGKYKGHSILVLRYLLKG